MTLGAKDHINRPEKSGIRRAKTLRQRYYNSPTFNNFDSFENPPTFDSLVQLPSGYLGAAGVLPLIVSSAV